jgi:hypothetical protein
VIRFQQLNVNFRDVLPFMDKLGMAVTAHDFLFRNEFLAASLQAASDPRRFPAAIHHSMHTNEFSLHAIIDRKRKTLGKGTVMGKDQRMHTGMQEKRVDIGK